MLHALLGIHAATIRDNILFGSPYVEERYAIVVNTCGVKDALTELGIQDDVVVPMGALDFPNELTIK
jgi:hypothetical protein